MFVGDAHPRYVHKDYDVFRAAQDRMRWLFEEFEGKVQVSNSGGKDSTVIVELAAAAAKEAGCLPLKVHWLDQECEYQATVDYQRYLMYERDDIDFHWYQIPFRLENSTNHANHWLNVWGEGEQWVRDREPTSIHENTYGEDHFNELLDAITRDDIGTGALLDGMRVEESPARRMFIGSNPAYKFATWSNRRKEQTHDVTRFQPIYDWSYRDVWKAIFENGWRYNAHYDNLFRMGVSPRKMRVSNYHHESSLTALYTLQEVEPETWEAATRRLEGISTYSHMAREQYPTSLPYMFKDWPEYVEYLIEHLVTEGQREGFRAQYRTLIKFCPGVDEDRLGRVMAKSVVGNDFWGTHTKNFIVSYGKWSHRG